MKNSIRVEPQLATALDDRGYKTLTPVQEAVLSSEMLGRDAIVSAQTGSGKTIAFGLSISTDVLTKERVSSTPKSLAALIVAPTRELALQVKTELMWLYANSEISIASCVGGMDMRTERRNLAKNPDIVLGTPGRLKDHIERGFLDLSMLKVVVLDEADEMLKLGFRDELEFILNSTPTSRRTVLYSATISKGIEKLAERYQHNAIRVSTISKNEQHHDIQYRAVSVAPRDSEHAIMNVLRYYDAKNALVFCATRATVNHLAARLNNRGFSVVSLSGELSQKERTNALQSMRDGRSKVCVATDVAARGIDLPNLELVIHADLPKNKESLLHRSGRTGRAGKKGVSILIVSPTTTKKTQRLLDSAQIKAVWELPPKPEEILSRDNERLLNDPIFNEIATDDETSVILSLIEKYSLEKIAGALVRKFRTEKFAPDEILNVEESIDKKIVRDDFKNGVWVQLSVGRNQKAEPRWILPTIIRVSEINKKDIGSIRIQEEDTLVELNPKIISKFMNSLSKNNELEPGLTVNLVDSLSSISTTEILSTAKTTQQPHEEGNSKQRRKARRAQERDTKKSFEGTQPLLTLSKNDKKNSNNKKETVSQNLKKSKPKHNSKLTKGSSFKISTGEHKRPKFDPSNKEKKVKKLVKLSKKTRK